MQTPFNADGPRSLSGISNNERLCSQDQQNCKSMMTSRLLAACGKAQAARCSATTSRHSRISLSANAFFGSVFGVDSSIRPSWSTHPACIHQDLVQARFPSISTRGTLASVHGRKPIKVPPLSDKPTSLPRPGIFQAFSPCLRPPLFPTLK